LPAFYSKKAGRGFPFYSRIRIVADSKKPTTTFNAILNQIIESGKNSQNYNMLLAFKLFKIYRAITALFKTLLAL